MQCKDLPDLPILRFLDSLHGGWGSLFKGPDNDSLYPNSVWHAVPEDTPVKLVRAKVKGLVSRGLIDGCTCGCRGDFALTLKGKSLLAKT